MATSEAGIAFVIFGIRITNPIVSATNPSMIHNGVPLSHSALAPPVLNWEICARKITIANPFTKPYMTDCGTSRMNFASLKSPTKIWNTPASAMAANTYSSPCNCIRAINTITVAPAPPEINPGRPPKMAVNKPMINAPYNPTSGGKPANKANESDSGIMVMATVNPARTSVL
ncbi:hypothetical protein D3C86_1517170 [compost metagenome]